MASTRRPVSILITALAAIAAATVFAGSAGAAPYSNQTTVGVSTTSPAEGGTLSVSGQGFAAGETVDLTLHSTPTSLGSTAATTAGDFSTSVTLPGGVTGSHTIVATGATSGKTASVSICIGGGSCTAGRAATPPGSKGSGGAGSALLGLPDTGVAVVGIGLLGLLLLVGGGALLVAGRRRKAISA